MIYSSANVRSSGFMCGSCRHAMQSGHMELMSLSLSLRMSSKSLDDLQSCGRRNLVGLGSGNNVYPQLRNRQTPEVNLFYVNHLNVNIRFSPPITSTACPPQVSRIEAQVHYFIPLQFPGKTCNILSYVEL